MALALCTLTLAQANAFVDTHHRHHDPVLNHRFSIGCHDGSKLVGAAICGRPVARALDETRVLEVNRLATDGTRNACSFLYGAAARAAEGRGFYAVVTYTLDAEGGASLRAAGWWGEFLPDSDRDEEWCNRAGREERALGLKWRWVRFLRAWSDFVPPEVAKESPQLSLLEVC